MTVFKLPSAQLPRRFVRWRIRPAIRFAICAQFRNEAPYLDEWIRFHLAQGVEHFFLSDDGSKDHFREVLAPWVEKGLVTLGSANGRTQEQVYTAALRQTRRFVTWIAFIDIDEFLFSPAGKKLPEVLDRFSENSAVFVFWKLFGSYGRRGPSPRGVIESFTNPLPHPIDPAQAKKQWQRWKEIQNGTLLTGSPIQGKSIVRTSRVKKMGVHLPVDPTAPVTDEKNRPIPHEAAVGELYCHTRNLSAELLRINHYWSRGLGELEAKLGKPGTAAIFRTTTAPRPKLSQARVWDGELDGQQDLDIMAAWRPVSAPYVFLIGFNKMATRAFAAFFQENGFPAVHWDENRLVSRMLQNLEEGRKVFAGYDDRFRFFSDLIFFDDARKVEGNAYFRDMDRDYPGSLFILNTRDTEAWVRSRERHNHGGFLKRTLAQLDTDDVEIAREYWRKEKRLHEEAVRVYFRGRYDFAEIDIDSDDVPGQISRFLDMDCDSRAWKIIGKTVDIGPYEKTVKMFPPESKD